MVWLSFTLLLALSTTQATPIPPPDEHVEYWIKTFRTSPLKLIRKNAVRNLGKMGDLNALSALSEAIEDKEVVVRVEAAKALGNLGSDQAIPILATARDDRDKEVRKAASDAVEKIKAVLERQKQKDAKDAKENPSSGSGY